MAPATQEQAIEWVKMIEELEQKEERRSPIEIERERRLMEMREQILTEEAKREQRKRSGGEEENA